MKFNLKNFARTATAFLLAGVLLVSSSPLHTVYAESIDEMQQEQSALEEKLKKADKKLEELKADKGDAIAIMEALEDKRELTQQRLDMMAEKMAELNRILNDLNTQITQITSKIADVEVEIQTQQTDFNLKYDEYSERLYAMYVSGAPSALEAFLTSSDFSSFLMNAELLSSVSKADSQALQALMDQMEDIKKSQSKLQEDKKKLNEQKMELEQRKRQQEEAKAKEELAKANYTKQEEDAKKTLDNLKATSNDWDNYKLATKGDIDRLENNIQQAIKDANENENNKPQPPTNPDNSGDDEETTTPQPPPSSSGMTWPAPKCGYLTTRFDPNGVNGRRHGGVDMSANYESTGLPIVAADSGEVIFTDVGGWGDSYGSYMMIRHSNGLTTLYAHCSAVFVKKGQKVKKGEQIGKVGNTGNSFGAHLHFEVRNKSGTRVDPLNYIKWGR